MRNRIVPAARSEWWRLSRSILDACKRRIHESHEDGTGSNSAQPYGDIASISIKDEEIKKFASDADASSAVSNLKSEKMAKQNLRRHDDDDMSIWVVYEAPPDFPEQYVARRCRSYVATGEYIVGDTLVELRAKLPPGLIRLERSVHDDPMVRESWI